MDDLDMQSEFRGDDAPPPSMLDIEDYLVAELDAEDASDEDEKTLEQPDHDDDRGSDNPALEADDEASADADDRQEEGEEQVDDASNDSTNGGYETRVAEAVATQTQVVRNHLEASSKRASEATEQLLQRMQQYDDHLSGLMQPPELPDPALMHEDPDQYQAAMHQFHHHQLRAAQAQREQQALQAERQQVMEQAQQRYYEEQSMELARIAPELAGDQTALTSLATFAQTQGYSPEQLSQASARDWTILHKAAMWERAQSAGKKLQQQTKRRKAAPKTTQPGPAKGPATKASRQKQLLQGARSKKRLSGNDLEAMFLAELEAEE